MRVLEELKNRPCGHLILVNLYAALAEGTLTKSAATEYDARVSALILDWGRLTDAEFLYALRHAVWDEPMGFQLAGPTCTPTTSELVVLKSYSEITTLIDAVREPKTRDLLRDLTSKPYYTILDPECEELATVLNGLASSETELHLSSLIGGTARRFNVWCTRLKDVVVRLSSNMEADNKKASRLRDELGLGHFRNGYPMFAFISTLGYNDLAKSISAELKRPTVFDGIDQIWFKYRRDRDYDSDNWGRATDLEKVQLGVGRDLDGAPEAISKSLRIPETFECAFVGRPIENAPEPNTTFITRVAGYDLDTVYKNLEALLR